MSITTAPPREQPIDAPPSAGAALPTSDAPPPADACALCGAQLAPDQEWCVECGAGRTLIHGAPDWRIPVAVVCGVVALALAGLAVALIKLSSDANRVAAAKVPTATTTVTVTTTTQAPAASTAAASPAISAPAAHQAARTAALAKPATAPAAATTTTTATTARQAAAGTTATTRNIQLASWPPGLGGWTVIMFAGKDRAAAESRARDLAHTLTGIGLLNTDDHPSMPAGAWVVFDGRYPTADAARAAAVKLRARGYATAHARMVEPPGGN